MCNIDRRRSGNRKNARNHFERTGNRKQNGRGKGEESLNSIMDRRNSWGGGNKIAIRTRGQANAVGEKTRASQKMAKRGRTGRERGGQQFEKNIRVGRAILGGSLK